MRVRRDITNHNLMLDAIDCFGLVAAHRGLRQIPFPRRHINKCDRIELGMNLFFHDKVLFFGLQPCRALKRGFDLQIT